MHRIRRTIPAGIATSVFLSLLAGPLAAAEPTARPADTAHRAAGGGYAYTLEQISPLTQSHPEIDFLGPYYYFVATNSGSLPDTYRLKIVNYSGPMSWFPQVCLRAVCFPDSTDLPFAIGESDTLGVQVTPFDDGVAEWDFVMESLNEPALADTFHMVLYAGTAATGVIESGVLSSGLELRQNVPNPVRGHTAISFTLPRQDRVRLGVYDVSGRRVADLLDGIRTSGPHTVEWDARDPQGAPLPAGVYFYRLDTSLGERTRRLTLVE